MSHRRLVLGVAQVRLLLLLLVAPYAVSSMSGNDKSVRMPNETLCGKEYFTNGVAVEASHFVSSMKYFSCDLKFTANTTVYPNFRWVLRIERIFIPYSTSLFAPTIYIHTAGETHAIEYQKDFSNFSGAVIRTQRLALQFVNLPQDSNYKFYVTLDTGDENCTSGFKCQANRYCIDKSLLCDGEDNCGDGTDESDDTCPGRADMTPLVIIVGGSVVLALLVGIAVMLVVLRRSKHASRQDEQHHREHLPRLRNRTTCIREPTRSSASSYKDATATHTRRFGPGYQPAPLVFQSSVFNQAKVHQSRHLTDRKTGGFCAQSQAGSTPSSPESIGCGSSASSALLV